MPEYRVTSELRFPNGMSIKNKGVPYTFRSRQELEEILRDYEMRYREYGETFTWKVEEV